MDSSDNPVAGWMLFLLFIVINSIFYGFGSAIQNLNENEIEDKAEQGDKKSKLLLHIMNAPGSLIQTVQFYHMLLSFLVGYVQLKSIMKTVSVSLSATAAGVFFTENPGKIILCILVLFVDLILLATFGILVPKRICSRHAAASAYRMVHMVQAGIILAWPITKLMELLTNLTVRLFGIDPNHTEDDVTEDEIIDLVDEAHEQGIIQESEAEMIQNIFHRYQSGGLSVFIDNNCNMDFFRLHCLKERIDSTGFRDISDGTNQLWNLHQAFGFIFCPILMFHGIFDMDKSNNIIDIFMVYRITGITVFRHIYNGILQQGSIVQRIDIFPVSHNIFC